MKDRVLLALGALFVSGAVTVPANAADLAAGAKLAEQCSACHGAAGVSTGEQFPNLAAQKESYITKQLEAFRKKDRTNPLMNAVAASLSDGDIENLAAHFASLPGAKAGESTENLSGLDGTRLAFPGDYETAFERYHRIDFEDRKQVRYYRANEAALAAAKAGEDFPDGAYLFVEIFTAEADADGNLIKDDDGLLVPAKRAAFTAMEKRAGWGDDVPDIIKNGDWRYAVFTVEGKHRDGLNEGTCLGCHKPLTETDYTFTYETLKEFALNN